jgi:asparagine synthase (glutamine-hydrolysing)
MTVPERMQLYNLLTRMGPANVFTPEFLAQIETREPRERELATFAATPRAATLNRTLAYEWKYILADNDLPKVSGTATLGGVDVGFPLLDDRLLDFSLALPPDLKVRGRKLRYFFKEALVGFLARRNHRQDKARLRAAIRGVAFA